MNLHDLISPDRMEKTDHGMIEMKKINYVFLLILLIVTAFSCTPPDDDDYYMSPDDYLCGSLWVSSYYDQGVEYIQELVFYNDGSGKEMFTYINQYGPVYEDYKFQWQWVSEDYTSIEMKYGPDDYIYFDDVRVYSDYLKGVLNGTYIEFESSK